MIFKRRKERIKMDNEIIANIITEEVSELKRKNTCLENEIQKLKEDLDNTLEKYNSELMENIKLKEENATLKQELLRAP